MGELEPAIPEHLRTVRTQPLRGPADFVPQHASHSARFDQSVKRLSIVYVGVQYRDGGVDAVASALAKIEHSFQGPTGPKHHDQTRYVDEAGYVNHVYAAYWDDEESHKEWSAAQSDDWWHPDASVTGEYGFFKEEYTPSVEDGETTFSHPCPEGISKIADHMSGETDTHEYWGSARDRIPRAQTEDLEPAEETTPKMSAKSSKGRHVRVQPRENLCVLRSGSDWSETKGSEREFFLNKVWPAYHKGMIEIRDEGLSFGCFFNRAMRHVERGEEVEKAYSLSAWNSLSDLERWVKADTHLAIWAAGIKHFKAAGDQAKLRLYHEMFVVKAADQRFDYFNCHDKTGMLKAGSVDTG